mmetsp:Transcript_15685/g.34304  ORF Transcript_15685/g.34304 Transcript_15685/m.34304 type:complete len:659 (-) Transcript_15685:128-2104(-)
MSTPQQQQHQTTTDLSDADITQRLQELEADQSLSRASGDIAYDLILWTQLDNFVSNRRPNPMSKSSVSKSRSEGGTLKKPKVDNGEEQGTISQEKDWTKMNSNNKCQTLIKTLDDLLQKPLVVEHAATQTSESNPSPSSDSKVAQTSTTQTASDSKQPPPHDSSPTEKTQCAFTKEITVKDALDQLHASMQQSNNGKLDNLLQEETHTHYVVNRIVAAAVPEFKTYFCNNWKSPMFGPDSVELAYYTKQDHRHEKYLRKLPDSLLYIKGCGAATKLTKEALSIGSLVSFEHKNSLNDPQKRQVALCELERDYFEKVAKQMDLYSLPVGYGVMTDGINWKFYKFSTHLKITSMNKDWFVEAESHQVCICKDTGEEGLSYNFTELAEWLWFVFDQSLKGELKATATSIPELDLLGKFRVEKFLGVGERRLVIGASTTTDPPQRLVIKFPIFAFRRWIDKNVKTKQMTTMMREISNLQEMSRSENIVHLANSFGEQYSRKLVVLEDVGVSLNSLICSGEAGKILARVVCNDIWNKALVALQRARICHADIHEGNICIQVVSEKSLKATLVDLESAMPFGKKLWACPIKNRNKDDGLFYDESDIRWDQASVCAILECLWDVDRSFADMSASTEKWKQELTNDPDGVPAIVATISGDDELPKV